LTIIYLYVKITRWLSEKCYAEQYTELDCVTQFKVNRDNNDGPLQRAQETWKNQLAILPSMSENSAANVVKYFPTRRSLFEAYNDSSLTESQKRMLLTHCFGNKKNIKMSDMIYRLMTTRDPEELIV